MFSLPAQVGYGALFTAVFAESAGVPLPGETSVLTAGVLAGNGHLRLGVVIVVAALAAILGDNVGYWVGRRGGRRMLERDGLGAGHRRRALAAGDAFFARHGAKTVFWGRWVVGVRIVTAVLAGASGMRWRTFLAYNALGALAWSASLATFASLTGTAGALAVYAAGGLAAGGGVLAVAARWLRRRPRGDADESRAVIGTEADPAPVAAG